MKAEEILKEYHDFVQLVDAFVLAQDKADNGSSMHKHEAAIAKRAVKTAVAKYRMTNHIQKKPIRRPNTGGMNYLYR